MNNWKSENIKNLRKQYKLSQKGLVEILGVSLNYIHLLEKGVKNPSKTLCLLLDCVKEKLEKKGA